MSAKSYYVHHTQRLSKAAACGNVMGIHDSIRAAKQRMAADGARPRGRARPEGRASVMRSCRAPRGPIGVARERTGERGV